MRPAVTASPDPVDPFELPDWLGTDPVVWSADGGLGGHRLQGTLRAEGRDDVGCDLLAVDEAYPAPVADDALRLRCHQAWRHGEVHLVELDGRLTLAVPGREFATAVVLDAVARFARALGASASSYSVLLRLGE